ncbi:MAG TPA: lysine 2,3-aminomutase, partial [Acidobacteriota bacterium]|nr:lysine 2,3-aminomutase [Acidobacteriota bacterium]
IQDVIDIATRVRRDGSGREIPRYIILTELGEVDFGLTSKMIGDNGRVSVKLLPYDLDYFKGMDKAFSWPATVKLDHDDKPIVPVAGLTNSTDFFIS